MADDTDDDGMDFDAGMDLFWPHRQLAKTLGLDPEDPASGLLFGILAALCDPVTQPEDTDDLPLSVSTLADVAIALAYQLMVRTDARATLLGDKGPLRSDKERTDKERTDNKERVEKTEKAEKTERLPGLRPGARIAAARFRLSVQFFTLLQKINTVIRADNELRVRYLRNDLKQWRSTAVHWLPAVSSVDPDAGLKLLYYVTCVVVMVLHKLFPGPLAVNPYAEYLLRLWKTHTSIIALALEMDRELEEEAWTAHNGEYMDTPELVKRALLGSLAIRTVLAYILDRPADPDPVRRKLLAWDLTSIPLFAFYDPLTRATTACGSISSNQSLLTVVALVLKADIPFLPRPPEPPADFAMFDADDYQFRARQRTSAAGCAGDLMVDLYYNDQFDEDIRYVFGYYDLDGDGDPDGDPDGNHDKVHDGEETDKPQAPGPPGVPEPLDGALPDPKRPQFSTDGAGIAERSRSDTIAFDKFGRDWRDIPREANTELTDSFHGKLQRWLRGPSDSADFFLDWAGFVKALEVLLADSLESISHFKTTLAQAVVNSVALAVHQEDNDACTLMPDDIYTYMVTPADESQLRAAGDRLYASVVPAPTRFEVLLLFNPDCARAILDELFMTPGLRRSLVWFLTHSVLPLMELVDYLYELVVGRRGSGPFDFSRKGPLTLSPIERLMVLHELFLNASKWCSDDVDSGLLAEPAAKQLVVYLCLLISKLMALLHIKPNTQDAFEDYAHDIQVLLIPWIGKVSAARKIFFEIKLLAYSLAAAGAAEPLEIRALVAELAKLDDVEYAKRMNEDRVYMAYVLFCETLVGHVTASYGLQKKTGIVVPPGAYAPEDYAFFLANFNEFLRTRPFLVSALTSFEALLVGDRPGQRDGHSLYEALGEVPETEEAESEFNDAFLNGEGQFQEADKKKKKKQKKRKKK